LEELLKDLEDMDFISFSPDRKSFKATPIGIRVSELYLDPLTAHQYIKILTNVPALKESELLLMLSQASELIPYVSAKQQNPEHLSYALANSTLSKFIDMFEPYAINKYAFSLMLKDWINEKSENEILEQFSLLPGLFYNKLQILDWLAYSASELAKIFGLKENYKNLLLLKLRLKNGIKQELIPLVELKGIGRVRARKLYNSRIKTIESIKKTDIKDLEKILGSKIAESVKKQLKQN
jgi:helicase